MCTTKDKLLYSIMARNKSKKGVFFIKISFESFWLKMVTVVDWLTATYSFAFKKNDCFYVARLIIYKMLSSYKANP